MTDDSLSARLGPSWDRVLSWLPEAGKRFRLRDAPAPAPVATRDYGTSYYRATLDNYGVDFPQSEVAEHQIFGRKARNASAKFGDAELASLRAYIDLHRTTKPMVSVWSAGVARSDKIECGPTPEKLHEIWSDPRIQYETRIVGYSVHLRREIKIPTSGPVLYFGVPAKTSRENEETIRRGGCTDEYRKRFRRRLAKNRIAAKAAAMGVPTVISYDERGPRWALVDINGLRFADCRSERDGEVVYAGQMLAFNDNDVDDRIRNPKELESPGSDGRFWVGTDGTEFGKDSIDDLKFYANDPDLNQKLRNDMDYEDFVNLDYDFEPSNGVTPFDVLAQKQLLEAVNGSLSPKGITTFAAMNDNAQSYEEIGRTLAGSEEPLSDKTLERRGKRAVGETVKEIHKVVQALAA